MGAEPVAAAEAGGARVHDDLREPARGRRAGATAVSGKFSDDDLRVAEPRCTVCLSGNFLTVMTL